MLKYLSCLIFCLGSACVSVEQAKYRVIEKIDGVEIREYPPQLVAQVVVAEPFDKAGSAGFRLLAGFIFGNNKTKQSIEMTSPVLQKNLTSEKIKMTAPVEMQAVEASYYIRFYMPAIYTKESLPVPNDSRVQIIEHPGGLYAAKSYSGSWSQARYQQEETNLNQVLESSSYRASGSTVFARYNSPWTLWFLRRNEVIVKVIPR